MRALLDENLPRKLKWQLHGVDCLTVRERGWGGFSNGDLLRNAAMEFDVFLTMDQGIEFQQNIKEINLSILLLRAPSNDYDDLVPLVPSINRKMKKIKPGQVIRVGS